MISQPRITVLGLSQLYVFIECAEFIRNLFYFYFSKNMKTQKNKTFLPITSSSCTRV